MNTSKLFLSVLSALLVFSACAKKESPPPLIRVAYAPHDHHAALYVAATDPEYFRENGNLYLREISPKKEYQLLEGDALVAKILVDTSGGGAQNIQKTVEDQVDIALGSFPEMVKAMDEGKKLKVIAPLMSGGTGLVVAPDFAATDWNGFVEAAKAAKKPLRIGVKTEGSVQQLALENALAAEGVSFAPEQGEGQKVSIVNLHGQKNLIPALKSGLVEGFVVMQPVLAEAQYAKAGKVIANIEDYSGSGGENYFPCCAVCAREDFLSQNRDASEKLMKLLMLANKRLIDNPVALAPKVAKWLGNPEEVEKMSLPTITYSTGFNKKWNDSVEAWLKAMRDKNIIRSKVREAYEKGEHKKLIYDTQIMEKLAG